MEHDPARAAPAGVTRADETSFNRLALKAPGTAVALFHAADRASAATLAALGVLAGAYAGRLRLVAVDAEESRALAEQLSVWALPTAVALRGGDELARACGPLPSALLGRFLDVALGLQSPLGGIWHPTEQDLEDRFLVPMIEGWGWVAGRQRRRAGSSASGRRGAIDILVFAEDDDRPLTLFENKRFIGDEEGLRRAVAQAQRYAEAWRAPSFVVADPAQLWVYAARDRHAALVWQAESYALERDDRPLRDLLLDLARAARSR